MSHRERKCKGSRSAQPTRQVKGSKLLHSHLDLNVSNEDTFEAFEEQMVITDSKFNPTG